MLRADAIPGKRRKGKPTGTNCLTCGEAQVWGVSSSAKSGFVPRCISCNRTAAREYAARKVIESGREYLPANFTKTKPRKGHRTGTKCRTCGEPRYWTTCASKPSGFSTRCYECDRRQQTAFRKTEKGRTYRSEWGKSEKGRALDKRRAERIKCDPVRSARRKETQREWNQTEKGQAKSKRGHAKRRADIEEQYCQVCGGEDYWKPIEEVYPNARCFFCGAPAELLDHLIPASIGKLMPGGKHPNYPQGVHCNSNFVPVCVSCNGSKGGTNRKVVIFPDTPEYEDWIHQQKLRRRRDLYQEKKRQGL